MKAPLVSRLIGLSASAPPSASVDDRAQNGVFSSEDDRQIRANRLGENSVLGTFELGLG